MPFGRVVLVVNGDYTLGRVYTPEGGYVIRTTGGMQRVERMEPQPLRCGTEGPPDSAVPRQDGLETPYATQPRPGSGRLGPERQGSTASENSGLNDRVMRATKSGRVASADDDVVDVLVVYPSFVREIEGTYETVLALIDLDIATANEAYAASGVDLQVNLVAAVEVEYDRFLERWFTDDGKLGIWRDAVDHLAGRTDGYVDEVHALRERHAADLVLMHMGGATNSDAFGFWIAGIALWINDVTEGLLEERGFSVARSGDGTVVAHELGHNMGLLHDRYDDRGNTPFPYSHGFRYEHAAPRPELGPDAYYSSGVYGTIMSQWANARQQGFVLAFSDPDRSHPQDPTLKLGVPGDEPSDEVDGPADAVRHLNEVRGVLANVRSRAEADSCRYEVSGDEGLLSADGETYSIHVETGAGCAWAVSNGDWVESVSPASGTGSGEIEVTVGANDGWRRPVEILVSGELHARRQAGSRPITPVCERSPTIRGALVNRHPNRQVGGISQVCWQLTFEDSLLAGLRTLQAPREVGGREIDASRLRPGDFDGLTGLVELEFKNAKTLPRDLFFGLNGLRILEFGQRSIREASTLTRIEPGAFRGLPGLVSLSDIWDTASLNSERVAFEGMPRLRRLLVSGVNYWEDRSPATHVEPGAFMGLSSLLGLNLPDNGLTRLDLGVFDGLEKLTQLRLWGNRISALPVGVFDGLSELEDLDLLDNRLTSLDEGLFRGLSALETLRLSINRIARLEPGMFDGLANLWALSLDENRLTHLPRDVFDGVPLEFLALSDNRLSELGPRFFANLPLLETLGLNDNRMKLEAGLFDGLPELRKLYLGDNRLRGIPSGLFEGLSRLTHLILIENELGVLKADHLDGLRSLYELNLWQAGITSLEAGVFEPTPILRRVTLQENRLRALAPGALRGVKLSDFDLRGNPGTPFTLAPTPVLVPGLEPVAGRPLEVAMELASAAPFDVTGRLSASGGTLAHDRFRIAAGETRGEPVTVTPEGDGAVTVAVAGRPTAVRNYCGRSGLVGLTSGYCYRGVRVAGGPPLVLYGFADRALIPGQASEPINLEQMFSYFVGVAADYTVESSDASVAAVTVEGETLTVTPGDTGTATVTVTATGADGEVWTRQFAVTVRVPSVELFLSGSDPARHGFVRLINRSNAAGDVRITAIDDRGVRRDPVTLRMRADAVAHFNSGDLEAGNESKGLSGGIGFGEGDWRLEFESALDIGALAYVRTADGFLTSMHDLVPTEDDVHRVAIFNPGSNAEQASRLRVINPGRQPAAIRVRGVDDAGISPGSQVRLTVPARAVRTFTAAQLESGGNGFDGALGDGEGKWRLLVESEPPVLVMSVLENASTGHLTNLSSVPLGPDGDGVHHVPLFPAADDRGRQGFARVVNDSDRAGTVRIVAYDDTGARRGPLELSIGAGEAAHFNSDDLELGNAAKGLSGSTGAGEGDWRLALTSGLDIEVLAYVRSENGFLTTMHDAVKLVNGAHRVAVFNPGSNRHQVSRLRLVNPSQDEVLVEIQGTDDEGGYPDGTARLSIPARGAVTLTASELEAGLIWEFGLEFIPPIVAWDRNPLGDGSGKWRLVVVSERPILVMSLLESPTGHLTNLSAAPH